MATSVQWKFLERDPLSSSRQLSVKGRRIKARTIAGDYFNKESPMSMEEIAANRHLPLEAVREAIAYIELKPLEVEQDSRFEAALIELAGHNEPGSQGKALREINDQNYLRLRLDIYGGEAKL